MGAGSGSQPSTLNSQPGPLHAAAQERHFIKRARQRFRLKLTHERYRHLVRKVVEVLPGTQFLGPGDTPQRTRWRIRAGGCVMAVVYDESTDRLVTCVPVYGTPDDQRSRQRERQRPDALRRWLAADHRAKQRRLATHRHKGGSARALEPQL
jgi:hypothetical protein